METFLATITAFPTVIFTSLFIFCIFYWLMALIGLVDLDVPGAEVPDAAGDSMSSLSAFTGLMVKLGLQGVPFPLTLSLITVMGWACCYFSCLLLLPFIATGLTKYLLGIPVFLLSFFAAIYITSKIINPLRPMFLSAEQRAEHTLIGKTATVRSSRVDSEFGEANVKSAGAELIINVRACQEAVFEKGDRVVLLEHVKPGNFYKVISEEEFNLN
ncbi:MAG: DUF1449 domain-containing protein [Cellvibrionaceae bacterium]|nr:DUF1449 domain-containing protein [Cellvibrionaceae bacterium]